jgi:hypothetical protein
MHPWFRSAPSHAAHQVTLTMAAGPEAALKWR